MRLWRGAYRRNSVLPVSVRWLPDAREEVPPGGGAGDHDPAVVRGVLGRRHYLERDGRHFGYLKQTAQLRGRDLGRPDPAIERQLIDHERGQGGRVPLPEALLPFYPDAQ